MNKDCLCHILSYCDVKDILTLNSVDIFFNNIINDDDFWKLLMLRDFEDINKLNNEKWLDYYKRRSINYGIPVVINNDIYQYNQVIQCISILDDKQRQSLILTKNKDLYIINNKGFFKINNNIKVNKIYGQQKFYFVDNNNDLYKLNFDRSYNIVKTNVNNVCIDHYTSDIYYSDKNITYYINNDVNQRILNFEILDLLKLQNIDYIINKENSFLIGKMINNLYKLKRYDIKAIQLSNINNKTILILGFDGFVRICRDTKLHRVKIPNVKILGHNSFVTKNGDLYYLDKTYKGILIDTDVIDVSYVTNDGEDGCYVKRNII
jgi:hypothetical protein